MPSRPRHASARWQRGSAAALGAPLLQDPRSISTATAWRRNRHCPKCQAQARERWLAARELLDVPYVHVVFTLPHMLHPLCRRNTALLYHLLVRAIAATLLEIAADPRHLGGGHRRGHFQV